MGFIVLALFAGVSLVTGGPALFAGLALALGKDRSGTMRAVGLTLALLSTAPMAFTLLLVYGLLFHSDGCVRVMRAQVAMMGPTTESRGLR